jgi:glutamate 5-kinase
VANLIEADLLILLTDQPGLLTADPRRDPSAQLVDEVSGPEIPAALWQAAGGTADGLGTGGMLTKLQAADLARRSGAWVVIARGGDPDVITRLAAGDQLGTCFHPAATALESRKRFILAGGHTSGLLLVDAGAASALQNGGSLLPVGVASVAGSFERGDTVRITDPAGRGVALGLANYASADVERIRGAKSEAICDILGYAYGDEVIHRNNMVML